MKPYRVVLERRQRMQVLRECSDRTEAETEVENLRSLTSTTARVQERASDGTWVDCEQTEVER